MENILTIGSTHVDPHKHESKLVALLQSTPLKLTLSLTTICMEK